MANQVKVQKLRLKQAWFDRKTPGPKMIQQATDLYDTARAIAMPSPSAMKEMRLSPRKLQSGLSTWLKRTRGIGEDAANTPLADLMPNIRHEAGTMGNTGGIAGGLLGLARGGSNWRQRLIRMAAGSGAGYAGGVVVGGGGGLLDRSRMRSLLPLTEAYGVDDVAKLRRIAPLLLDDSRLG